MSGETLDAPGVEIDPNGKYRGKVSIRLLFWLDDHAPRIAEPAWKIRNRWHWRHR